jgi:hypothetical protein
MMHSFAVIGVEHNSGDGSRFLRYEVTLLLDSVTSESQ